MQKIQIEWEKLNVETNERLYVLQRGHTLYSEIEVLRQRVETIIDRVEIVLNETINSSKAFQQAKNHLNKLKVIIQNNRFSSFSLLFFEFSKLN